MSSLLPQEHREPLQKLRWKYKKAEKVIRRKARTENFLIFVSVCGLVVLGMLLLDRNSGLEITGRTAAILSVPLCILGCWTYFRRSSQIADTPERLLINEVNDELEALGYNRDFVVNAVVKRGSSIPRDVTKVTSYSTNDTSLAASMVSTDTVPDLSIQAEQHFMIAKQKLAASGDLKPKDKAQKSTNFIFKTTVDAFNYAEEYFAIPTHFDSNDLYLGLVMEADGKGIVLLAHRASGSEGVVVNRVVATANDDLKLAKLDLVIWQCYASLLGKHFGTVLKKLSLELDLESGQFREEKS